MEKRLSFVLRLSLEQMALRRIAVVLYSEPRVLASLAKFSFNGSRCCNNIWTATLFKSEREWRKIVEDKMSKLQLPNSLAKQMTPILKAVGSEIFQWKKNHEKYFSSSTSKQYACLQKLCWTTAGTVDYRKTAEALVCCDVLDIVECFELACLYCLEDSIPRLWEQLSQENKISLGVSWFKNPSLLALLPHVLAKRSTTHHFTLPVSESFVGTAIHGSRALAEYFFRKLSREEREQFLVPTAKDAIRVFTFRHGVRIGFQSDVACYLLSLMTHEEQMKIAKDLPIGLLRCFLGWPWQNLFIDLAGVICSFIPKCRYTELMNLVCMNVTASGYYFPNLYKTFFLDCPIKFRKHITGEENYCEYFCRIFFQYEDAETLEAILRNVDASNRVGFVTSDDFVHYIVVFRYKWHLFEACLRDVTPSQEDKKRLKEYFIESARGCAGSSQDKIDRFRSYYRRFFETAEDAGASAGNWETLSREEEQNSAV